MNEPRLRKLALRGRSLSPTQLLLYGLLTILPTIAPAAVFTVNTTEDLLDANPGDGFCNDGTNRCSLRGAVMEANALTGTTDVIMVGAGTYMLTNDDRVHGADIAVTEAMTILGSSPESTIIDGGDRFRHFDASADLSITNVTLRNGLADPSLIQPFTTGGSIRMRLASLTLTNVIFKDNVATDNGGAVSLGGPVSMSRVLFDGNLAGGDGGAVAGVSAESVLEDCEFVGNHAFGSGGAATVFGAGVQIRACTFRENSASVDGGAIRASGNDLGAQAIVNSTFSGNSANRDGGAILSDGMTVNLYSVTVTDNQAGVDPLTDGNGGGLATLNAGQFGIKHTIVSGNRDLSTMPFDLYLPDCGGNFGSLGWTIGGGGCNYPINIGDQLGVFDPGLAPLSANGGFGMTHALLPTSPALNSGSDSACLDDQDIPLTEDQRGAPRFVLGACDIGAYEAAGVDPMIFSDGFDAGHTGAWSLTIWG